MATDYKPGTVIKKRYVIIAKINSGGEGCLYSAYDKKNKSKSKVAIKIILKPVTDNRIPDILDQEYSVMKALKETPGFPRAYHLGIHDQYPYLVMELLGTDLFEIQKTCTNNRFNPETMLQITDQLLKRLEAFHEKGYIHGDLKPENIVIGRGTQDNLLYLIDFGLSVPYRDLETGEHLPLRGDQKVGGTLDFSSRHVHHKFQQSRRDDMESLSYVLASLANEYGSLPWNADCDELMVFPKRKVTKDEHLMIANKKDEAKASQLFPGMPPEFGTFHEIVKNLGFDEKPKYNDLRYMFRDAGRRLGVTCLESKKNKMRFNFK